MASKKLTIKPRKVTIDNALVTLNEAMQNEEYLFSLIAIPFGEIDAEEVLKKVKFDINVKPNMEFNLEMFRLMSAMMIENLATYGGFDSKKLYEMIGEYFEDEEEVRNGKA